MVHDCTGSGTRVHGDDGGDEGGGDFREMFGRAPTNPVSICRPEKKYIFNQMVFIVNFQTNRNNLKIWKYNI